MRQQARAEREAARGLDEPMRRLAAGAAFVDLVHAKTALRTEQVWHESYSYYCSGDGALATGAKPVDSTTFVRIDGSTHPRYALACPALRCGHCARPVRGTISFFSFLSGNKNVPSEASWERHRSQPRSSNVRSTGRYERTAVAGEAVDAFVPTALPPRDPPLVIEGALRDRLQQAEKALSRLELAAAMVPSVDWFLYGFVRKEAVISSQIEGTQATLLDLLTFEAQTDDTEAGADVEEVCNYVDAVRYARKQLHDKKGAPLSMRLLNESHRRLMRGVRGHDKKPGEPRRSQNWIGGSRPGNAAHVPPPPHLLPELLRDFEKYLHVENDSLPLLVRAGLLHVQFETIHPYLDGNGRIGRLLIALVLEDGGLLTQPLLYLSLFFKRHRVDYYRRLNAVRIDGDWEGWTEFFLDGVATVADEAVSSARELFARVGRDRNRVLADGSASVAGIRLFEQLPKKPIVTVAAVMELLETTKPRASRAVEALVSVGVLVETTGKKRDRAFAYRAYLDLLRVGTELEGER